MDDKLQVVISANLDDLEKKLKQARQEVQKFSDGAAGDTKKFGFAITELKTGIVAATAAIGAMAIATGAMVKGQIEAAAETRKWAKQLSIAESEFAALVAVGKRFGATTDDVGDSIKDLNERIADAARGNKTFAEAFGIIGLSAKKLLNLPLEEQFIRVADAIGKLSNAGDRNFVTATLMADAGFRLLPVFQQGEKAIRAMKKEVVATNEALDAVELKKLADLNQSTLKLSASWESIKNTITISLLPAIEKAARLLKDAADYWGKFTNQDAQDRIKELDELNKRIDVLNKNTQGTRPTSRRLLSQRVTDEKELLALLSRRAELTREINILDTKPDEEMNVRGEVSKKEVIQLPTITITGKEDISSEIVPTQSVIEEELERLEAALHAKKVMRLQAEKMMQDELDIFREQEFGAEDRQIKRIADLHKLGWKGDLRIASEFSQQMLTLTDGHSKKMFNITKALGIADAIVNTAGGVTKALNGSPPFNFVTAASVAAAGLIQIQKISSQSFNGGGGGGGGGGGSVGAVPAPVQQEQITNVDISLQGDRFGGDGVRGMLGAINSAIADGGKIGAINVR
jgi:hypothetical protein